MNENVILIFEQLDVILPTEHAEAFSKEIATVAESHKYAKVYIKPCELLEGDFFNHYIKSGIMSWPIS